MVSFQVSASLFQLVVVLLLIPGHASLTKVKHGNTSGRISDNCWKEKVLWSLSNCSALLWSQEWCIWDLRLLMRLFRGRLSWLMLLTPTRVKGRNSLFWSKIYLEISQTRLEENKSFYVCEGLNTQFWMFPGWRRRCLKALWDPVTCWLSSNRLKAQPGPRSGLLNCWTTQWSWSERWSTLTPWCSPTLTVLNSSRTPCKPAGHLIWWMIKQALFSIIFLVCFRI